MLEELDIEEIFKNNPCLSKEDLERGLDLSAELKNQGLLKRGYNLASLGEGRTAQIADTKGQRHEVKLPRS